MANSAFYGSGSPEGRAKAENANLLAVDIEAVVLKCFPTPILAPEAREHAQERWRLIDAEMHCALPRASAARQYHVLALDSRGKEFFR